MHDPPLSIRSRHAVLVLLGALLLQVGALAPWPQVRALLVIPPMLLAPGHALQWALLGLATPRDRATRLGLAGILSLANYSLLALALSYGGLRLTTPHILAGLDLEQAALAAVIAGRAWCARFTPRVEASGAASAEAHARGSRCSPGVDVVEAALEGAVEADGPMARTGMMIAGLRSAHASRPRRMDSGIPGTASCRGTPTALHGTRRTIFRLARTAVPPLLLAPVLMGAYALVEGTPSAPYSQLAYGGDWARVAGSAAPSSAVVQVPVTVRNGAGQRRAYRLTSDLDGRVRGPVRLLMLAADARWSGRVAGAVPDDACVHRLRVLLSDSDGGTRDTVILWVRGRLYGTGICVATAGLRPAPGDVQNPPRLPGPGVLALRPATLDDPWRGSLPAQEDSPPPVLSAWTGADAAVPGRRTSSGA